MFAVFAATASLTTVPRRGMSGEASENARAEGVAPDAPPGDVRRDEVTRDQREEAGPFPEYVDLYINGEPVSEPDDGKPVRCEAPWITWKDGWRYCIACSRFAERKHQTGKDHLRKVGNWLLDNGYKEEQKDAVIQSIYLESGYSKDSSAAEEAPPGSSGDPEEEAVQSHAQGHGPLGELG